MQKKHFFHVLSASFMLGLLLLAQGQAGCNRGSQAECQVKLPKRTADKHGHSTDPNNELIVLSMDTVPTLSTSVFESVLKHFNYEYILLGSPPENPQPPSNGLFKLTFWNYRFHRYLSLIKQMDPEKIVLLTDANDVMFAGGPKEIVDKFKSMNKRIVLSGNMCCCNVGIYDYVKTLAERRTPPISDLESTDPLIVSMVKNIVDLAGFSPTQFGEQPAPSRLWTPQAKHEIELIKKIPFKNSTPPGPATKYRYLNAGGIIGYAKDLAAAMEEINPQKFDDDEEQWSLWYAKPDGGYESKKAIIDYEQRIFAVVDEMENRDGEVRILYGDYPGAPDAYPSSKFFNFTLEESTLRWKNDFGNSPAVFHCAGCGSEKMHTYRKNILDLLPELKKVLTEKEVTYIEKC